MILLVDVGNSRIKWATLHNTEFEYGGAVAYTESNFFSLLASLWSLIPTPEQVIVSNVAGDNVAQKLSQWVTENFACRAQYVAPQREYAGLTNGYSNPQQLGIDRWMSMLSVWGEYQSGYCLVDCGTAVTVDAVNHNGVHLGGLIIPGIKKMQTSLTDELPGCKSESQSSDDERASFLANNTVDGINGGCTYASAAFINQLAAEVEVELGSDICHIITGGGAQSILPLLEREYDYRPHAVLEGLARTI